jgi:hypothetical protein
MKKKNLLEMEYLMLEGCLVQPFVKLGVRKPKFGEFFGLPENIKFIPHPEP